MKQKTNDQLIENEDFYYNDQGLLVLSKEYHLKRGHCCTSGCKHCPYGIHDFDPSIPIELQLNQHRED